MELSVFEQDELEEHEQVIAQGVTQFVAVGRALLAIRDNRLYRGSHDSFEVYCDERWGFKKSQAYRLIEAAEVVEYMSPIGDTLPHKVQRDINESQVRELAKVPKEQVAETWAEVVETAPEGKVTAKHVREVVERKISGGSAFDVEELEVEVLDALGRPVTPDLHLAFAKYHDAKALRQHLVAIKKWINKVHDEVGGELLGKQYEIVMSDLGNLDRQLRFLLPYTTCPYCKNVLPKRATCSACVGRGWVDEQIYKMAPEEMK